MILLNNIKMTLIIYLTPSKMIKVKINVLELLDVLKDPSKIYLYF
jgi:hypothetical protein